MSAARAQQAGSTAEATQHFEATAGEMVPTVTAEAMGEGAQSDYRTARMPRSVSVILPASVASNAVVTAGVAAQLAAQADANPAAASLAAAKRDLQLLRPAFLPAAGGVVAPITLASTPDGAPAAAPVAMRFDAARAGARVWVQAIDGGSLDGTPGGRWMILGADGGLAFVFQPPAGRREHAQVSVRLDNIETVLRFHVVDPAPITEKPRVGAAAAVAAPLPPPTAAPDTAAR